jgi:ankyrin repeat protein
MLLLSGHVFLIDGQRDGLTALHVACVGGNKEVVEALLSAGASVEASAVCC